MAAVIHRTTLAFDPSANETEHPEPEYKHNPNMTGVIGVPQKHWKAPPDWDAVGAGPVEMSQAEKDAVDAAILNANRDAATAQFDQVEGIIRAIGLVILDELNGHKDKINGILTAIDNGANLTAVKANIAAIADYPTRTAAQIRTAIRNKLGS